MKQQIISMTFILTHLKLFKRKIICLLKIMLFPCHSFEQIFQMICLISNVNLISFILKLTLIQSFIQCNQIMVVIPVEEQLVV